LVGFLWNLAPPWRALWPDLMVDRPHPITLADELVAAVHDRLVEQNDLLRQLLDRTPVIPAPVEKPAAGNGSVLITEPAPPPRPVAAKKTATKKVAPKPWRGNT
jgi:hypothetical protein